MLKPFKVVEPASVGEACAVLGQSGEEARIYCGGTELLTVLKQGLLDCQVIVDIKTIPELGEVKCEDGRICIGAATTHRDLEGMSMINQAYPVVGKMARGIGNVRVRNVGTVGGNLCFADPHSDVTSLLLCLGAELSLQAERSRRVLSLEQFLTGAYETAMAPDEVLTRIDLPATPKEARAAHKRFAVYERPTVVVSAAASASGGKIESARAVVGCVGPVPRRLHELEEKIRGEGRQGIQRRIGESKEAIKAVLSPISDLYGSAEYKIHIASVLLQRAFEEVIANEPS